MKCVDCKDYKECRMNSDLRRKRHRCNKAKDIYVRTNADHIRSMTDDELAAYILCPRDLDPRKTFCADLTCIECAKDWLKQPYEEDT